jgi:phosphatidylglycerophosphate synthase
MIGRAVGFGFATTRDTLAKVLIRLHVTPNALTLLGTALTLLAGACYAVGATSTFGWTLVPWYYDNAYLLLAGVLLVLSSACDMLDGAVARLGGMKTDFGAFLDSTLDRVSDFAVFGGIAMAYVSFEPSNLTFSALSMLAFLNAFMVSYTKARAEDLIESCKVGFWQRGERCAAVLIATFAYNIPALILQQSILTIGTVLRRILHTRALTQGRESIVDPRSGPWTLRIRFWRWPRMTVPYDLTVIANIAFLIFVRIPDTDILRQWVG